MTPYRVLVNINPDGELDKKVYSAMLSIDLVQSEIMKKIVVLGSINTDMVVTGKRICIFALRAIWLYVKLSKERKTIDGIKH